MQNLSMFPLILPNDRIGRVVKKNEYELNDIVVFGQKGRLIAHRVIWFDRTHNRYITKGDRNRHSDNSVKKNKILGAVVSVKRDRAELKLNSFYLTQSLLYFQELSEFSLLCRRKRIRFIILKGLPVYLHFTESPPQTLLVDLDILIHPEDVSSCNEILKSLGFRTMNESGENGTQMNWIKLTNPLPVIIDLHWEPAFAFTRIPILNTLIPQNKIINDTLWENAESVTVSGLSLTLLDTEVQILYLLIHVFHHNLRGTQRFLLIAEIFKTNAPDLERLKVLIPKCKLTDVTFIVLTKLTVLFPGNDAVNQLVDSLRPSSWGRCIAIYFRDFSRPWNTAPKLAARLELFCVTVILSPVAFKEKVRILCAKETVLAVISQVFSSRRAL